MSDFSAENLEHQNIVDLVRAFAKDADAEGKCNGFTSMWLQAVLTGKKEGQVYKEEQAFYERLNRLSRYLPGKNIRLMDELPENPLANPEAVKGNIYLTKEGNYIVYTQALDGSGWVEHKGSLIEDNVGSDNINLKKALSELEKNRTEDDFKYAISSIITSSLIKKIEKEVNNIFQSKVYNLFLMSAEINNGGLPAENAIFVEKSGNKLKYIVLDRNDKSKVINGELDIDIGTEELTTEKLEKLRSEILRKTSLVGHTRSAEENQLTEAQLNVVEMRAFAENVLIQQDPGQTKMFDIYVSQDNKSVLSLLTQSMTQGEKSITPVELGTFIGSKKDLESYFSEIESTLAKREVVEGAERVTFLFGSDNHAVGVYFDDVSKRWHFMDVNRLSGKKNYYADVNSAELADHLFDSYFDDKKANTTFSITRLSMNPENEQDLINEKVKTLSKNILTKKHSFFLPDKTNSRGSNALILAGGTGQKEMVATLIKNSASVNKKNNEGLTPLFMAVQNGHLDVVKDLFKAGAKESKSKNNNGVTLLMMAAKQGHTDIVKLLLDRKNDVNEKDSNGMTALGYAVLNGKFKTMELLFSAGAREDEAINNDGSTLLMMAVNQGNLDILKSLLDRKYDVNKRDNHGMTALRRSVLSGRRELVDTLLKAGAKIDEKDEKGLTALMSAISNKNVQMIKFLLDNSADVNIERDGVNALFVAMLCKEPNIVNMLIEHEPNIIKTTMINGNGASSLAANVISSQIDFFDMTQEQKASFSILDTIISKETDPDEIKKSLEVLKAKFNKNNYADILSDMIINGYTHISKAIIEMSEKNTISAYCLVNSAQFDNNVIRELLLKEKEKLDNLNDHSVLGYPLLIRYVKLNDIKAVQVLIEAGIDVTKTVKDSRRIKDKNEVDKTAMDIAVEMAKDPNNDMTEIIEILSKALENTQSVSPRSPVVKSPVIFSQAPVATQTAEPKTPTVKSPVIFSQTIAAPDDLKSAALEGLTPRSSKSGGNKPSAGFTPLAHSKTQEQAPAKSAEGPAESTDNPTELKKTPIRPGSQG